MRLGIIRVVSNEDPAFLNSHGRLIEQRYPVATVTRCIAHQPHGVHDDETFERAVPKVVDVARVLVDIDGVDAVMVSCAADPGVPQAREVVQVPVIGAGSAAAAVALAMGGRVGVLGITDDAPVAVTGVLGDRLAAVRRPQGVHRTTDLMTPDGRTAAVAAARELAAAGAQSILFACTGLTTIGLDRHVAEATRLPVIDAVLAAGLLASYPTPHPNPGAHHDHH